MEVYTAPQTPEDDEFGAAYQGHRDQRDGGAWQQHLAQTRRPQAVQTLQDVQALVAEIAPRYGVDPKLVESVIGLESGGNPLAISQKGAQGVMQLMPGTAQRFGVRDPLDAQQNIEGGIRYLAFLKSQFPGRTDLQLAGYHAGEGAVRNAGYAIPQTSDGHMTTQQYVQNVMSRYQTPQTQEGAPPSSAPGTPGQAAQPAPQAPTAPERVKMLGTELPGVATPAPVADAGMPAPPSASLLPDQVATAPGLSPLAQPFPALEEGLVEPRPERMVGAIGSGAVGMVKGLFNAMIAGQTLVGMTEPGKPDPIRADLVVNVLDKVQQDIGERRGGAPQDFWDKLGSGIGTSLVSIVPAAGALQFLRGVGQVAPRLARWGASITSGIIEAASEGGSLFEQMKPRVGEDEAAKRALMSFGQNVVLITATDRLGIFGDQATLLRRALAGVVTNAAQEEMQYDVERRQLWVPATHKAAEALQQQGWVKAGERLIKPYSPKEAAEAMLLGAIIGGPAAAAVGLAAQEVSTPWQNLKAREQEAAGGTVDPQFSIMNVFKAAQNQPAPEGVEPETWQRWGNYLKDLLPQPTGGPGILASERGSLQLFRSSGLARQLLPESQVRDAGGNLLRMYHGTSTVFEQFDAGRAEASGLYGPGLYFTDNPEIAGGTGTEQTALGYATAPSEETQRQRLGKFASEEEAQQFVSTLPPAQQREVEIGVSPFDFSYVVGTRATAAPNVRPVYLDIQQPFDIDGVVPSDAQQRLATALEEAGYTDNRLMNGSLSLAQALQTGYFGEGLTGATLYRQLEQETNGDKQQVQTILEDAGYDGITHTGGRLSGGESHKVYIAFSPEQVIPAINLEAQAAAAVSGTAATPSDLTVDIPPTPAGTAPLLSGGQPTLRGGAEGLPQEQYRTPSGDWVIPRKNIPLTELELKDFIGEMKGIQLEGEELQGELRALISPSETGIRGLQNNVRGVSLQEMAEIAQQYEFIRTADKEALLEALDRSVNLGQKVYSMQATGRIPLLHDPHVRGTYQAVLDAVELMETRTEEQVAGVRVRREVHQEARDWMASGMHTLDDIREVLPNIAMNDVTASAMMQQLYDIAVNLGNAADAYLQNGARIGSQEESSLQQTMALLAELDPTRLGVSAAQSRGLGILNDPLSGYTQYLNALHKVLSTAPNRTMEQIAKKIVAARPQPAKTPEYWQAHPEELAAAFADMQAVIAQFAASEQPFRLEADELDWMAHAALSPEDQALVDAAYRSARPGLTPDQWAQQEGDRAYAAGREARSQQWFAVRDMIRQFEASRRPFQLEADEAEMRLGSPLSAEDRALVEAAYRSARPGLTPDQWAQREGDRAYAAGREARAQQWFAVRDMIRQFEASEQPFRLEADELDWMARAALSPEDQALVEAAYRSARPGLTPAQWAQQEGDRAYAAGREARAQQWFAVHDMIRQFEASRRPFQLEADEAETLLGVARTPEEQALIDAAYRSARPGLTPDQWAQQEGDRAYAAGREARAQQWFAVRDMIRQFEASQQPFRLEADEAEIRLGPALSAEDQALVDAAYTPTGPARTPEEWHQVFRATAQSRILAAWQAGAFERERAQQALLPDLLELNRQREAERQRAMEDWTPADRARDAAYAEARKVWARQAVERAHTRWQQGIRDFRQLQAELRAGYEGRPVGLPPREGAPHHAATQMTLLDEYQAVQAHLADYLAGRATAEQKATFMHLMEPWTARQEQLTIPTLKAALQSTKPGFEQYFLELWFNALLSSPTTHATNFLSNTVTATWALPERFVAEQFSHGRAGGVARGESAALLYGFTHGAQGAWAGAVRSWKAKQPVSGVGRETFREPAFTSSNVGLNPESGLGQFADFFFEYVGLASGGRLAGRALMAADEFFHLWNYYGELNALAYREAVRQGYEGRAFAAHVERIVTSPNLSALQQAAKDFAVMQTFQKPIEPGSWGAGAQWAANIRIPLGFDQTFPVGRVLIPFTQTPVNIANYAMERTLMAPLFASYQADIEAGKTEAGRARADMAHAKMTLGTIAMVAAAGFVLSGRLVGRGPEDPELRAIWRNSHEEYSFRLPTGHWVSTRWLGPAGQLLNFVADAVQIAGEADTPLYVKLLAAPTYSFLKNIGNQTFMSQLNDFFDAMWPGYGTSAKEWMRGMQRWGFRQGAQFAQPSSFLNVLARAMDPAEKQATEFMNVVYSRIPGWGDVGRSGVPSRRTLGGEKVLYGWGFGPDILANTIRAYSPLKLGDGLIYPADLAILENKMSLNSPARSLIPHALAPGMAAQGFTEVDLNESGGLRLTDVQYEKYQVLAGGNQVEAKKLGLDLPSHLLEAVVDGLSGGFAKRPPRGTRSLDDYTDWLVKQPEFLNASPDPGGGKEKLYQQAVRTYRMVGLQLLLAQDEPLRQRYEESQMALQTKQLPLGERQPVIDEMRRGYREAAPRVREELGLRVGGP